MSVISTSSPVPDVGGTTPGDSTAHLQRQILEMDMHIAGLKQQLQRLISGRAAFQMELLQKQGSWKWLLARGSALCRMFFRPLRDCGISPFHLCIYFILLLGIVYYSKIVLNIAKHYHCVRIEA